MAERDLNDRASRAVARWSDGPSPADLNPVEELIAVASKILAFQRAIEDMLAELPEGDWRRDHRAGEQLHSLVSLMERALDRSARVLVEINKLGLEDRRVRLAESQAQLVVSVIRSILGRLELSDDQRRLSLQVVPEELKALSEPKAIEAPKQAAFQPGKRHTGRLASL